MPTPRAPRKDAAENRTALLDAARVLLNRDPSASLEAIAIEAGLSRRTVYGHFPTRDGLLEGLAQRGTERVAAAVAGVEHDDPVARLALIAARAWDDIASIRVMTVSTVRSPRAAIVDEGLAPVRARITEAIQEGAASGAFRSDIPAGLLARLVEESVVAVVPVTLREGITDLAGRELVVKVALGAAGLGWREVDEVFIAVPEIMSARRSDELWPTIAIPVITAGSAS